MSPYIARWISRIIQQWLARKFQERMRQAMGFPPGDKTRRDRRSGRQQAERRRQAAPEAQSHEPLIPKEYAVDVEYTEIHEYSERTEIRPEADGVHIKTESQVTDAEYLVIKPGEYPEFPSERKGGKFKFWKRSK